MSATGTTAPARPRPATRAIRAVRLPGRRARRRLCAGAAVVAVLAAGHLLWLRDSAFVEVRTVTVTGLVGADSERIQAALTATARGMTTLHVDREKLDRAASAFPVVHAIEVRTDFPHAMRIHVVQEVPAAVLASGSSRTAVAADGTVLTGLAVPRGVPVIHLSGALPRGRVTGRADLARVKVAGGAPAALRARVEAVRHERGTGTVAVLRDGPKLIFGDGTRVAAKWAAAVSVLADRSAAGADYVDLRIPERPAAGGLPVETVAPIAPAQAPADPHPAPPTAPAAAPERTSGAPATQAPAARAPAVPTPAAQGPTSPPPAAAPAPPDVPVTTGGGAPANPQP